MKTETYAVTAQKEAKPGSFGMMSTRSEYFPGLTKEQAHRLFTKWDRKALVHVDMYVNDKWSKRAVKTSEILKLLK